MERINKQKDDKIFHCQCRQWRLTNKDQTNTEIPPDYFMVHSCDKIQVWQKKKTPDRLFIRK